MENYIIMCRSITHAQRGAHLLERANVRVGIVKAPQGASTEGCSYGLRVSGRNMYKALEILKRAGVRFGHVFMLHADGNVSEVEL